MGKKRKGRLKEFQRREQEKSTSKIREERKEKIRKLREDSPRETRKKKKITWNRTRIIKAVVIILVGTFVVLSAKNIISLKLEQKELLEKNHKLTEQKEELSKELNNVDSREYIEKQAREILKMVKPNEKIFVID